MTPCLTVRLRRVTIGDKQVDLVLHEGETAEEAVIALCRKEDVDHDVSGCIRHLLPLGTPLPPTTRRLILTRLRSARPIAADLASPQCFSRRADCAYKCC